ncbi:TonB-dependent receptor [Hyphomicrobium sp. 2TAF46]|uniref:TonB-dependent receptor n=1 Tax=Hyphomicrobium sp. 2TAF46 TaxID=3233019 RepID=UPI003F90D172
MLSSSLRRAPLQTAAAFSISTLALLCFLPEAFGQEVAKPAGSSSSSPQLFDVPLPPVEVTQPSNMPDESARSAAKAKGSANVKAKPKKKTTVAQQPSAVNQVLPSTEPGLGAPSDGAGNTGGPPANTAAAAAAKLDVPNGAGSMLNLTPREMPATLNVVTEKEIEENGLRDIVEIFQSVPGVLVGDNPGEPGSTVTRGIYAGLGYSIDGSRVTDPNFVSRNYDSFNLERVEFLKGPASVVSGTNALAGSVNIVTKQATTDRTFFEGMAEYGSFDSQRFGAGMNVALSPAAAFRSTISYSNADSFIDDTSSEKFAITNNILLKPSDRLTLKGSVDYYQDKFTPPYWGTPLIPRALAKDPTDVVSGSAGLVLDKALRSTNYNYLNGKAESDAVWLRGSADYKLNPYWTFKNESSYYTADRSWRDAEYFNYDAGSITRSPTIITHDHSFWSERASFNFDGNIGGLRNRFTTGAEYIDTQFNSARHFGSANAVDIFDPDRGPFPVDNATNFDDGRKTYFSHYGTTGVFLENALNLTPSWLVLGGLRYEYINLDRSIRDDNTNQITTAFTKDYEDVTWRVGTTYEIVKNTSLFAQYATATVPISSLLTGSLSRAQFDLSKGRSAEAGIKSTYFGGRVTTTASFYQIDQDNILTNDPNNPTQTVQGGSLRSRGIELDTTVALTERWNVTVAGTVIDAEYTNLYQNVGGELVSRNGNMPVNASPYSLSASTSYRLASLPATVGMSVNRVGPFYTDTANTIKVNERTLLDAWISYDIGGGTLRIRGRNLTDEIYAYWADYNPGSVYLGAPRSFDVSYTIKW